MVILFPFSYNTTNAYYYDIYYIIHLCIRLDLHSLPDPMLITIYTLECLSCIQYCIKNTWLESFIIRSMHIHCPNLVLKTHLISLLFIVKCQLGSIVSIGTLHFYTYIYIYMAQIICSIYFIFYVNGVRKRMVKKIYYKLIQRKSWKNSTLVHQFMSSVFAKKKQKKEKEKKNSFLWCKYINFNHEI